MCCHSAISGLCRSQRKHLAVDVELPYQHTPFDVYTACRIARVTTFPCFRYADIRKMKSYPCGWIAKKKQRASIDKATGEKQNTYKDNYDTDNMVADQWCQNGA